MLYHEHLRKDLPSADSVQYRHLPLRGITQKEQDGLIAFLQLTTVIVNWVSNLLLGFLCSEAWDASGVTITSKHAVWVKQEEMTSFPVLLIFLLS